MHKKKKFFLSKFLLCLGKCIIWYLVSIKANFLSGLSIPTHRCTGSMEVMLLV